VGVETAAEVPSSAGTDGATTADEDEDDKSRAAMIVDIEVSNVGDVDSEMLTLGPMGATAADDVFVIAGSPADIEEWLQELLHTCRDKRVFVPSVGAARAGDAAVRSIVVVVC
jgi:hypothetical protein